MEKKRAHVIVSGRVQGVNFRVATRDQARQAGVVGWVKNLPDGRVEAVFEGALAGVRRMVSWCYSGPIASAVDHVEVTWEEPEGTDDSFIIHY